MNCLSVVFSVVVLSFIFDSWYTRQAKKLVLWGVPFLKFKKAQITVVGKSWLIRFRLTRIQKVSTTFVANNKQSKELFQSKWSKLQPFISITAVKIQLRSKTDHSTFPGWYLYLKCLLWTALSLSHHWHQHILSWRHLILIMHLH